MDNLHLFAGFLFLYIAIVLGIGWFSSKKETRREFVTARRSIGAFGLGSSLSVGWIDVAIFSTVGAISYEFGWASLWLAIGLSASLITISFFIKNIKTQMDQSGCQTMIDYYAGRLASRRFGLICGIIAVVYFVLWSQSLFIIGGKILADITPLSYTKSLLLVAIVTGAYLQLGGFTVVLRTDVFQFIMMFLLALAFIFPAENVEWQWTQYEVQSLFEPGWWWIFSFFITLFVGAFCWPDAWQRFVAAKTGEDAKNGLRLVTLGFGIPVVFMIIFVGTTQFYETGLDPETAVIFALQNYVAPALVPLLYIIIIAILMSSLDTTLFGGAVAIIKDVISRIPRFEHIELTRGLLRPVLLGLIILEVCLAHVLTDGYVYLFFALSASICLAPSAIAICVDKYAVSERAAFWSTTISFVVFAAGASLGYLSPFDGIVPFTISLVIYIAIEVIDKFILRAGSQTV